MEVTLVVTYRYLEVRAEDTLGLTDIETIGKPWDLMKLLRKLLQRKKSQSLGQNSKAFQHFEGK